MLSQALGSSVPAYLYLLTASELLVITCLTDLRFSFALSSPIFATQKILSSSPEVATTRVGDHMLLILTESLAPSGLQLVRAERAQQLYN